VVNIAARRWVWSPKKVGGLAHLSVLGFEMLEPDRSTVARWPSAGLTASTRPMSFTRPGAVDHR
jgi:hypothetical protein